jgi:oxygen-dependent protoporphyrinogen oxidase
MDRSKKRIAIIGSGITGLTTAYRMKKIIEQEKLPFELMVLEGSIRSGGNILTMKMGEHYVDVGAESIDARVSDEASVNLVKELGLQNEVEYSQNGKVDIFAFNQLYSIDAPSYKGIPMNRGDIWKYDILSFQGKLSYLKNAFKFFKPMKDDQKISTYLKSRLGEELYEYVAEPFFSNDYSSEIEEMGIRATREPLVEIEEKYGQITKGIQENQEWLDGEKNYWTFKKGLETLTGSLSNHLVDHIQYSKKVTEIKKIIEGTYILDINHKEQVRVGTIIVATDSSSYQELFTDSEWTEYFRDIRTGSVGYVLLGFPKGSIKNVPTGCSVVSPRRNDSYISKVTWLNKKWNHLTNVEEEMIGVHFGRTGEDIVMSLSNSQLEEVILNDLNKMLGITEEPLYRLIKRWPNAIPQFTTQHEKSREKLFTYFKQDYPGVYLAGNGIDGFGIHSCIKQAEKVSRLAIQHLKKQNGF